MNLVWDELARFYSCADYAHSIRKENKERPDGFDMFHNFRFANGEIHRQELSGTYSFERIEEISGKYGVLVLYSGIADCGGGSSSLFL